MRTARLVLPLVVLLAGCTDEPTVHVRGLVRDEHNIPAARAVVFVVQRSDEGVFQSVQSSTDDQGNYDVELRDLGSTAVSIEATSGNSTAGADVALPYDGLVPDLHFWDAALRLTPAEMGRSLLSWNAAPADLASRGYQVSGFVAGARGRGELGAFFSDVVDGTTFDLTPELIEDFPVQLAVVAGREHPCPRAVCTWVRSLPTSPVEPDVRVPVSRGASCSAADSEGALVPLASCPYTDGSLEAEDFELRELRVELFFQQPLRQLVVRGLKWSGEPGTTVQVELSLDGSTFTPVATLAPAPVATDAVYRSLTLPEGTTARWIRLRSTGTIESLQEISAF